MDKKLVCSSCKKRITNEAGSTRFKCPKCGKFEIIRCKNLVLNVQKMSDVEELKFLNRSTEIFSLLKK